ncbi:MAG: ABC transporter permease [Bacteroidota bacterium]
MPYLLKMAWRNLGRHRGRTILSLLAVMLGVFVVVLAKGFVEGMLDTMLSYNVNLNSGHVRLIRPEYEVKERLLSLAYPIGVEGKPYSSLVSDIRKLPGVTAAMGRIRFGMLLTAGENRQELVLGVGAEMPAEEKVVHFSRFLRGREAGRFPRAGEQEILLGEGVLQKLQLKVGDKVNALFSTSFGSFKIATFRVTGRMHSGLKFLDESVAYLPLDVAMGLLDLEDMVTEIVVFGENTSQTARLQSTLDRYLAEEKIELKTVPWNLYNELIAYLGKAKAIYMAIYLFVVLLASFVVFNTLLMVVSERVREIGMLSALGLTPRAIRQLFLWEGGLIAVLGSAAGIVFGGGINGLLSRTGIDFAQMIEEIGEEMLLTPRLYPKFGLGDLVFAFVLGVCITMLAAYLPARRAGKLQPTEALRTI